MQQQQPPSAERFKAFTDAVVAIAMTLLILPLMESVSEIAATGATTAEWFLEERAQILSLLLSFVLIADAWRTHHRVFDAVHRISRPLTWLSFAWMLAIVWLPVATALLGRFEADPAQVVAYVGTLVVLQLTMLGTRLVLRASPQLHTIAPDALRAGIQANVVAIALFAIALVVALAVPAIGYASLGLLLLMLPASRILSAVAARRARATGDPTG